MSLSAASVLIFFPEVEGAAGDADFSAVLAAVVPFFSEAVCSVFVDFDSPGEIVADGLSSTVAEAFSSGEAAGDSSWAKADATKLSAATATSDIVNFIYVSFPEVGCLNAGSYLAGGSSVKAYRSRESDLGRPVSSRFLRAANKGLGREPKKRIIVDLTPRLHESKVQDWVESRRRRRRGSYPAFAGDRASTRAGRSERYRSHAFDPSRRFGSAFPALRPLQWHS